MPHRILVLRNSGKEEPSYLPALKAQTKCEIEIRNWAGFRPQELNPSIHLVLVDTVSAEEKALGFLGCLRGSPISTPFWRSCRSILKTACCAKSPRLPMIFWCIHCGQES